VLPLAEQGVTTIFSYRHLLSLDIELLPGFRSDMCLNPH
jgi:hypothetical protein